MASRMTEISVDCHDPDLLAAFWCEVLGWVVVHHEPGLIEIASSPPDDAALLEAVRSGPVVPTMFFAQVPEDKVTKNRIHFDVSPVDRSQADEVERILALGATRAEIGQTGVESWTVLADPEGNEFCVLRSLADGHFSL